MACSQSEFTQFLVERLVQVGKLQEGVELADSTNFSVDLEMDSLDTFTLIFDVEERYGTKVPEQMIDEHLTVGILFQTVTRS